MAIRPAISSDAETLGVLLIAAGQISALIDEGDIRVMTQDSDIVGALMMTDTPDHLFLPALAVAPLHRHRGFDKVLLLFAEQEARNRGHDQVRVPIAFLATETLAVCRSLGYREVARNGPLLMKIVW